VSSGLAIEKVSVRFGGHLALSDVSLTAEPGKVTGLIGANGAGKTTLFNVITGLLNPTQGRVVLDGKDISKLAPFKRSRHGIARTFQRLELFTSLSVRDNIKVAGEIRNRWHREKADAGTEADRIIDLLGLRSLADREVSEIPTGMARRVEVGRALMTSPQVLLLDEPASGQDEGETEEFGQLLRGLADAGTGILLVEHDVALVMAVCDYIHMLDFGQIIARGTPNEIRTNQAVLDAYLGSATDEDQAAAAVVTRLRVTEPAPADHAALTPEPATPLLELVGIRAGYGGIEALHGVNLAVPEGAVMALLGPNGAGKSTLVKVCAGLVTPTSGEVLMAGRPVTGVTPDELARHGVCMIPEGKGIFPNLTVRENLLMASYTGASPAAVEEIAYERFPRLHERRTQLAGTMSGGEQQMLAMARALSTNPAILLLDELSMGLAPVIVQELYEMVAQVSESGVSVLVVEQFARTVLGVADVAAIMLAGRITQVGLPEELEAELSSAYLGGSS
jgi:ABC-type branched-subunit amino acid transport system ATPase component